MKIDLTRLDTEKRNKNSENIDTMSTLEILTTINEEDKTIPYTIEKILPTISEAVDAIYERLKDGGRLIYMGAGTSGRLGILDASECPPTYGVDYELVQGLIAGGKEAIQVAREGAEDSKELAVEDLKNINLTEKDVVCGLAASGRTPYVIGGLEYGNSIGAMTLSICCVNEGEISKVAKIAMEAVVGPEVVTGSTRMKAGTAQKLILNMLSTSTMIKLGKVYGNLMVDVKPTNEKLVERAKRIISMSTGCSYEEAAALFEASGRVVKTAIMMALSGLEREECEMLLNNCEGNISKAIKSYQEKGENK